MIGGLARRGAVDLDRPVGEWARGIPSTHAAMTLPQMLAHVSGIKSSMTVVSAPTLDEAAQQALALPVAAGPGERFHYGASSMTLAAWIAEQQTGKPWRALAEETIFGPLGMSDTVYANPVRPLRYGLEAAPEVASGVHSTAADYMTFLGMIARHGRRVDGLRVLSARVVRQLEQARTIGAERGFVPPAVTHEFEYAMGTWCERWDGSGRCLLLHSQGAFGTRPFLDRESGIYGIVLMVESGKEQRRIIQQIREVALKTVKNELGFIQ
ncbi:MAG: serine hydrolase domain-containing protein [Gammaproteobacteria bacterium]|nr:serine hydrolase domain-containing protein [Gammaproteobacteria bacterium]